MSFILGFGQCDSDAANRQKSELSNYLKNELEKIDFDTFDCFKLKGLLDDFQNSVPKFRGKSREWAHCFIHFPYFAKEHDNIVAIVRGKYSAYNNNHPLSPDGFACLDIPYNLSILIRQNPNQNENKDSCLYEEKVEIF